MMVTLKLDWPQATNKGEVSKPMPVAGVMQQQGITFLDLVCIATRKQQQATVMVRGLDNVDIQTEILSEVEQMSLEDTITCVSMRESEAIVAANARMPTQTVSFRNAPRGHERCTQAVTHRSMAQRVTTQAEVSPDRVTSEQD